MRDAKEKIMTLAAVIEQSVHDALSPELQAEYISDSNGKFKLDVRPIDGFELANTTGLKKALETERHAKTEAEKATKAFGDLDVSAARDAIAFHEKFKDANPDETAKQQFEAMKGDLITAHQTEMSGVSTERDDAFSQLRNSLVTSAATKALQEAGGVIDLLLPHVEKHIQMEREGDRFVAKVVDEKGIGRVGDGAGNPMTIPQLVAEMKAKESFQAAFTGTNSSGSGSGSGDSSDRGNANSGGGNNDAGKGAKSVNANDQGAINSNLESIASGETKVTHGNT